MNWKIIELNSEYELENQESDREHELEQMRPPALIE